MNKSLNHGAPSESFTTTHFITIYHSSGHSSGRGSCGSTCVKNSPYNGTIPSNIFYTRNTTDNSTLICTSTCVDIPLWYWLGPMIAFFGSIMLCMLACCIADLRNDRQPSARYLSFRDNVKKSSRNVMNRDHTCCGGCCSDKIEEPTEPSHTAPRHDLTMA